MPWPNPHSFCLTLIAEPITLKGKPLIKTSSLKSQFIAIAQVGLLPSCHGLCGDIFLSTLTFFIDDCTILGLLTNVETSCLELVLKKEAALL